MNGLYRVNLMIKFILFVIVLYVLDLLKFVIFLNMLTLLNHLDILKWTHQNFKSKYCLYISTNLYFTLLWCGIFNLYYLYAGAIFLIASLD